ncbi:MAG: mechanosensitive ion channel, partial [Rhodospirillaceae bacterium]|nr:mechanosensitive ion channel [Rhodospirillaceae bacterium]
MDAYLDLANIEETIRTLLTWLKGEVFVVSTLAQLIVVVLAYLPAHFISSPLENALEKAIAASWADKIRAKLRQILRPMVQPLVWLVLLGAAQFTAQRLQLPFGLLQVGTSLLTAWIVIRIAINFIADPWWSRAVALFVWTVAALDIIGLLDPTVAFLDAFAIDVGEAHVSLLGVIKILMALVVFLWIANALSHMVENRLGKISHLTPSQQVLFGKLTRVVLIVVAILIAINSVGIDLTALAVFSGAVGLGVGFGLQKVVSNLISGVILLM